MRNEVAAEVRAWAGRRNYNQTRVARVLGVSQAAVSRKYRGEVAFDVDDLFALAEEWDIPVSDLMPQRPVTKDPVRFTWTRRNAPLLAGV